MGYGLGINNYWQSMPYGFNNYNFGNSWGGNNFWNTGISFPSSASSTDTASAAVSDSDVSYEAFKTRLKEEAARNIAENQKKELQAKDLKELEKEKEPHIKQFEEQIKEYDKQLKQVNSSKQKDGSAIIAPKPHEQGFWGKAGRWLSNAGTALKNMGKSFIGIEKDGSWNWKKCLKNVAITAAAVGATFIPGVGPIIGAGLLAGGVVSGAVGVAKGVKKLNNAKTVAEYDQAQQDICSGAFVGLASAAGLKGLGKSARVASSTSSAASKTSVAGKVAQGAKNTVKDMTVNVAKATKNAVRRDINAIHTNGGGVTGFVKTYSQNAGNAWRTFNSRQAKYDNAKTQLQASVDQKIAKVDADIQTIKNLQTLNGRLTPAEQQRLALLKEERFILNKNRTELNNYFGTNTREKTLYDNLIKENSGTSSIKRINNRNASAYPNRIQGKEIPQAELKAFYKRMQKEQAEYSKAVKELVNAKTDLMRYLAKHPDANISELSAYMPSPNASKTWYKPSTWTKNEYQLSIGGHTRRDYGGTLKTALTSPASMVPLGMAQWEKDYSGPMLISQELTSEETEQMLTQLEEEKKALEASLKQIKDIKTKEEWNALMAQAAAAQQAQQQAQEEDAQTEQIQNNQKDAAQETEETEEADKAE